MDGRVSIILLLAGIGAMVWFHAARKPDEPHGDVPDTDPLTRTPRDAVAAGGREVLLGRLRAARAPDRDGRRSPRTTASRATGFYGIPARQVPPVHGHPHLAHAARHLLDRDRLARRRSLHRARGRRRGAEGPAARRERALRRAARRRARLDGRPVAERHAASSTRPTRGSTSATAATSTSTSARVWQIALLIGLFLWLFLVGARDPAGAAAEGRAAADPDAVPDLLGRDRRLLRRRARLRAAHEPRDRRVLALVGRSPLGRRASSRCSRRS